LNITVIEIDDFIEQKRSARRARKPGADQLVTVGQVGVASGAGIQPIATDVVEEYPTHLISGQSNGMDVSVNSSKVFSKQLCEIFVRRIQRRQDVN